MLPPGERVMVTETLGLQRGFLLLPGDDVEHKSKIGNKNEESSKSSLSSSSSTATNAAVTATPAAAAGCGSAGRTKSKSSSGMKSGFLLAKTPSKRAAPATHATQSQKSPRSTISSAAAASPPPETSAKVVSQTTKTKSTRRSSGSGFVKGFLVSKTTRPVDATASRSKERPNAATGLRRRGVEAAAAAKAKTTAKASPDFLSLEDPSAARETTTQSSTPTRSSSFLIVATEDQPSNAKTATLPENQQRQSKPLISVMDDDYDDIGGGVSSDNHGDRDMQDKAPSQSLMSILEEESDSILQTTATTNEDDEHEHAFLFQEKATTFYSSSGRRENPTREPLNDVSADEPLMTEVSALLEPQLPIHHRLDASTSPPLSSARIDTPWNMEPKKDTLRTAMEDSSAATSFLAFQQQLARMKWDTDANKARVESGVVEKWTPSEVSWAWEWLFSSLAATSTSMPTPSSSTQYDALIQSLLQCHPSTIQPWLVAVTPHDRARALQLIRCIQDFVLVVAQPPTATPTNVHTNTTWRENVLPNLLILAEQPRRTVLAQEAWTTCILLIVWICEQFNWDDTSSTLLLPTCLPLMDILDRLFKTQLRWKHDKTRKQSAKHQAQIRLLEDWIQVNRHCRKDPLLLDWHKQVLGISLDDDAGKMWGGHYHLFCGHVLAARGAVASCCDDDLSNVWQRLIQSSLVVLDPMDQGILLRGVLAQLSTAKQLGRDIQDATVANVVRLLPDIRCQETCEIALSILSFIWFDSNGLPEDLRSFTGPGLPKSVEQLLVALSGSTRDLGQIDRKTTPFEAISAFIAKCILEVQDDVKAVEALIERQGMGAVTVRILFHVIRITRSKNDVHPPPKEKLNGQPFKQYCT